jgi:tetratricopeptide (TPR) repeat protein
MSNSKGASLQIARGAVGRTLARASQLRAEGRLREAIDAMRSAASLEPNNAQIVYDLGVICLEAGLPGDAAAAFRRAVQIKPNFAQAFWRLGMALEERGQFKAATGALRQAIALQPRLPEAQFRLGLLLEQQGHRREAGEHYRQVLSAGANVRLRRSAEARALLMEGRDAEAEEKLRRAVKLEPDDASALGLLAALLTNNGAFEESAHFYELALAQPGCVPDLYYHLVRCRKYAPQDSDIVERLRSASAKPLANPTARIRLHLALGKVLDDLGRYAEAMQAFDAAANIRASAWPADVSAFEQRVDEIVRHFSAELIESKRSSGNPDPTPVLIFGMPRSGTTLVEQIASAHPLVHGAGEVQFWNRTGARLESAGMRVDGDFFSRAALTCMEYLRKHAGTVTRIIDKNPFNFLWAGLFHIAFPRGAMIHCRRNPIDTALSIHQTYFNETMDFPTGGEALVRYFRAYERLMEHWRHVLPQDRFLEVDYEDLTADPLLHSKRMIAHIGLEWDDCCLRPEMNSRRVKTASSWQVRQPIYQSSVERWRKYEPYLGPLADLVPSGVGTPSRPR